MDIMIDNRIMNYSLMWPERSGGVADSARSAEAGSERVSGADSQFVRPSTMESGIGWLPAGMGENVDMMV